MPTADNVFEHLRGPLIARPAGVCFLNHNNNEEWMMDQKDLEMQQQGDSKADAFAAVVLISVFVAACIFWISGQ